MTFGEAPSLPDWLAAELPFRRRIATVDGRRVHFVDHGEGPAVLLVHGNPTWSFLWRKVIARLHSRFRCIAPDLLGLGMSERLAHPRDHRLDLHIATVHHLVQALDLDDYVVVGQDWGGPIAAGVAAAEPERVAGVVFGNTGVIKPRRPLRTKGFHRLSHVPGVSDLLFRGLNLPVHLMGRVQGDDSLGRVERAAYRWPLRRLRDRAAPLGMARMVPGSEDHPSTAVCDRVGEWVEAYRGPAALVWGLRDPILGRGLRRHRAALPQAEVTETQAGHFLQEQVDSELAAAIGAVRTAPAGPIAATASDTP